MGRTPKLNKNGGRDHYGNLTPLVLAGGGFKMGQVIGKSDHEAGRPVTTPVTTADLISTVLRTARPDEVAPVPEHPPGSAPPRRAGRADSRTHLTASESTPMCALVLHDGFAGLRAFASPAQASDCPSWRFAGQSGGEARGPSGIRSHRLDRRPTGNGVRTTRTGSMPMRWSGGVPSRR